MPVRGGGLPGGRGWTRGLASATAAIATATAAVTFPEEDACKLPPILPGLTACLQHRPMWTYDSAQVLVGTRTKMIKLLCFVQYIIFLSVV